jgi:uncharacterized membrane protein YfcA
MHFPVFDVTIDPVCLVALGFVVGVLGGVFGVGGSFLVTPVLYALGLPMSGAIGTDLAHILGKSIVAAKRHSTLGNIDYKLGFLMVLATMIGVEGGVRAIERLKHTSYLDLLVGIPFICVLVCISAFMCWESVKTMRMNKARTAARSGGPAKTDVSAFGHVAKIIQRFPLPPFVQLRVSNIGRISVWPVFCVGLLGGFFSGFFGGGAGYIRLPALIYLLGIPTHVAVGTDLFEIIISAGYGTFRHAREGNVDILIALVMLTGAALGARIGATLTQFIKGPVLRLAFMPLPLIGAALLLKRLWPLIKALLAHP